MRWIRTLLLFPTLLIFTHSSPADDKPKDKSRDKPSNRLARESSPYLLQHAHNPVDWYPWGEEAFAKAKKEGKLVFLSIGYSSCHWCHVMERESFSNKDVAEILNKHFICIKVDREERPDVDHIYMTALQAAMDQHGGWPLSMFLTDDGKPIAGGTYWPADDKEIDGRKVRGFKSLLKVIIDFQKDHADDIRKQADENATLTKRALIGTVRGLSLMELKRDAIEDAVEHLKETFDKVHGGFGSAAANFRGTKFPRPPSLLLLQHEAARSKAKDLDVIVQTTLDKMAMGGIYDQLGGGFHRYSTERTWTVPHFEKMLYDNAQLLEVYAQAYTQTKKPLYKHVLQQTIAFVDRELTSPNGAFYSALDADSEGEEGRFYVWTGREIGDILKTRDDATLARKAFGADGTPNFEGQYHILTRRTSLTEIAKEMKLTDAELEKRLDDLRGKLLEARGKKPKPFLDTKVLTAWNGEMIAGLARAGKALDDKKVIERAVRAADFLLKTMKTKEGRLLRTYGAAPGEKPKARLNGYLDDYAYLVHGLLCLHDATGEARWLNEAKELTEAMVKFFGDKDGGGFFCTSSDHEKFFARAKDQYDGVQPSGNSQAAMNLVRLWQKTGDEKYAKLADRTFRALGGPLRTSPGSVATLSDALAMYLDGKKEKK
jgi:uncharacterized protein YyaL (SSP411 family)